jgi:two-component system LytT family response regulator
MIKTIAIDDEYHCLGTLEILISEYCPDVQLIDKCQSPKNAFDLINKHQPDLVFLDIEMPGMTGFELLEQFDTIPFSVIFTTGYDKYAIRAIRVSALDYLLKPVDPKDLKLAVEKIRKQQFRPLEEQFRLLLDRVQQRETMVRQIAVPTRDGFEMILIDQLIRCEADDNYTRLFLKNNKVLLICKTLKETEEQLREFNFFARVHHSFLVNLNEVTRYVRGDGGYLIMRDGSTVDVSKSRKESLLKKILH